MIVVFSIDQLIVQRFELIHYKIKKIGTTEPQETPFTPCPSNSTNLKIIANNCYYYNETITDTLVTFMTNNNLYFFNVKFAIKQICKVINSVK